MDTWMYVVGAIILFIALILALKVNIVVSYKDELCVYLRILFVKINLIPKKEKIKIKKEKKAKQKTEPAPSETEKKKGLSPVKVVWEIREAVLSLLKKSMNRLHFKFARLNIEVGCEDAAKTALAYGAVVQGVAYILEILESVSNVEISRFSHVNVSSNFISRQSKAECKITLYIRVFSALGVLIHLIKTYFTYNSHKDKLTEVKNGKNISE